MIKHLILHLQALVVIVSLILLITVELHIGHVMSALLPVVRLSSAFFGLLLHWPRAFLRRLLTHALIVTSPVLIRAAANCLQFAIDAAHVCDVFLERLFSSLVLLFECGDVIFVLLDVNLGLLGVLVLPEELLHLLELLLNNKEREELDKVSHEPVDLGSVDGVEFTFGPKEEHNLNSIKHPTHGLRSQHERLEDQSRIGSPNCKSNLIYNC